MISTTRIRILRANLPMKSLRELHNRSRINPWVIRKKFNSQRKHWIFLRKLLNISKLLQRTPKKLSMLKGLRARM